MKIFGSTDPGLVRRSNEDRFTCAVLSDTLALGILCDGMGGEKGGSVASEMAMRHVKEMLERDLGSGMSEMSVRSLLFSAITGANALVYEAAQGDKDLAGMGTTLIAAVLDGATLYVAYVGDSRVYYSLPGNDTQLTRDHTVVQMLVDIGEISEEDAVSHPKRHYITRAVGVSPTIEVAFLTQQVSPEGIVLLCSDGLHMYLGSGPLYPLLTGCVRKENARPLIELANIGGGSDNITAIVLAREESANG